MHGTYVCSYRYILNGDVSYPPHVYHHAMRVRQSTDVSRRFLLNSDTLCEMDASSVARATPAAMAVTTATAAPAFGTASFGKELCVVSRGRTTAALEGLLDDDEGNNPEPDDDEGGAAASTPHAAMEPVGLSSSAAAADAGDAQVLEPVAPLSESREEADRRNVLTMIRGEAPAFCSSDRLR